MFLERGKPLPHHRHSNAGGKPGGGAEAIRTLTLDSRFCGSDEGGEVGALPSKQRLMNDACKQANR